MSNKISTAVKYMQMPNVPKQVLRELADFADDNGRAFPSITTLAAALCLTTRSVINGLSYLRDNAIITQSTGIGGNNIYYIHPENFKGEFKYPRRVANESSESHSSKLVNDVHQCNTFTSESGSPTSECHSQGSESRSLEVVNDVHTNHHINHQEPLDNHQYISADEKHTLDPVTEKHDEPKSKPKSEKIKKPKTTMTTLPENFEVSERVKTWAAQKGFDRLEEHLEYFTGYAVASGKKYADWDQALMNAIRGNWAKLKPEGIRAQHQAAQPQSLNASYWANFNQLSEPEGWYEPIDVTPKKTLLIEGVGHA
ncbi:helix-turn-helix domain-containing protein [Acinetobacter soli]|uniref:helix-turn-helix domain-containing protein n=1 Tax=Acinetobacter soli TaxID=487316 RepID=UPI00125F591C|nr:helix-turn-helix domain-containing protein [Acinetobacter soli]